ncbi:MAG: DUF5691 domain-containing protein [Saprospiraceae bacterium]|nr:DUF5691 domain-containing protein [Saprospiraceae bacterium]
MAWNELVKMALLGTEKLPLQTAVLPDKIREILDKSPENDREAAFLKAAALTWLYEKAGQKPNNTPLPNIPIADAETLTIAPPPYNPVFQRLLSEEKLPIHLLLTVLLEKMADKDLILPHDLIVPILSIAEKTDIKNKPKLLQKVVGERGKWLAPFNKKWAFLTPKPVDNIWLEGSNAERRDLLETLRQTDPVQTFAYIGEVWDEINANERRGFLKLLEQYPSDNPDELAFLERLFEELSDEKLLKKEMNRLMRETVVGILLLNPKSNLYNFVLENFKKYVKIEKKLLGLSSKTKIVLPEVYDDFLNLDNLEHLFGVKKTGGELIPEFMMRQFLTLLHPQFWSTILTGSWADDLKIIANTEGVGKDIKKHHLMYLAAAAAKSRYRNCALDILKTADINATTLPLFGLLTDEELGKMAFEKLSDQNLADFVDALKSRNKVWSRSFSQLIINYLAQANDQIRRNADAAKNACLHFDLSVLNELYDLSRKEFTDYRGQQLRSELIFPMIKLLEYRLEIERLL